MTKDQERASAGAACTASASAANTQNTSTRTRVVHFIRHGHCTVDAVCASELGRVGLPYHELTRAFHGVHGEELRTAMIAALSHPSVHDSPLTPTGHMEAATLASKLAATGVGDRIGAIVTSSLQRALQTTDIALGKVRDRLRQHGHRHGFPVVVTDLWREYRGRALLSNHRKPASEVAAQWSDRGFDVSGLAEVDDAHEAWEMGEPSDVVQARVWDALMFVLDQNTAHPDASVAVVTHGGFVMATFRSAHVEWVGPKEELLEAATRMGNCELFTLELSHAIGDSKVKLRVVPSATHANAVETRVLGRSHVAMSSPLTPALVQSRTTISTMPTISTVTRVVHFIRHGHATLNASIERIASRFGIPPTEITRAISDCRIHPDVMAALREVLRDPAGFDSALTPKGRTQAAELARELSRRGIDARIDVIVTSSSRRTLQTTDIALGSALDRLRREGKSAVVTDLWREYGSRDLIANHRPSATEVAAQWGTRGFDVSGLAEVDPMQIWEGVEPRDEVQARVWDALMMVLEQPAANVAVVTHGGFFSLEVLNCNRVEWIGPRKVIPGHMGNCELVTLELSHTAGEGIVRARVLNESFIPTGVNALSVSGLSASGRSHL